MLLLLFRDVAAFPTSFSIVRRRVLEYSRKYLAERGRESRASGLRHRGSTSPVNGVEGADGGEGGSFYTWRDTNARREDVGEGGGARRKTVVGFDTFVSTRRDYDGAREEQPVRDRFDTYVCMYINVHTRMIHNV